MLSDVTRAMPYVFRSAGHGRRRSVLLGQRDAAQVTQVTEGDLARMARVGKAIAQLRDTLAVAGLSFRPRTEPGFGVALPSLCSEHRPPSGRAGRRAL